MSYLMGIDIATTGTKTLLINEQGTVISSAIAEYEMDTPKPNWAEQDPADWWQATINTIKAVLAKSQVNPAEIKGIGLTGQMHGLVLLDENHQVLRPCIMWCDQRTAAQCDWITQQVGKDKLVELTRNPVLTGFTAPKIIWVRDNEPQIYEKIHNILLPKDYIRYKLTGEFAIDAAEASGTSLLDVVHRIWADEILKILEIPKEWLPKVCESPMITGTISKQAAQLTGLKEGTPVVGGGGDQSAGGVGNGIVKSGVISSTIGTSGVVFAYLDQPICDPQLRTHTFCHAVPGKWHVMGVMLSAGGSFRWFRDTLSATEIQVAQLCDMDPYEFLTLEASKIEPGCEGLIFLPYLMGERTPYPDPNAKGVFFGLTLRHTKSHLVRAVMEGVAFGLRDSLEIIKAMGVEIKEVRASGGGAKSDIWRQIQADINNCEMVTINVDEGPAFGAALLAGVGTGIYKTVPEACEATTRITTRTEPIINNVKIYEDYYKLYGELYWTLKQRFDEVSGIVAKTV